MVFTAGLACVMVFADTYMQSGLGLDAGQSGLALMLMQVGSLVGGAAFCTVLGILLVIVALAFVVAMRRKTVSSTS